MTRGCCLCLLVAATAWGGGPACFEIRSESPVVTADEGWLFLASELSFLAKGEFWGEAAARTGVSLQPQYRDPLPAMEDFARQLKAAGVDLAVLPVPPKALIHADRLGCTEEEASAALLRLDAFYDALRARGIRVLDLGAEFLEARDGGPPLYCRTDTHWSTRAIRLAAARIGAVAREAGVASGDTVYARSEREVPITGDLVKLGGKADPESLLLSQVSDASGLAPAVDASSPLLLLGDSHVLVFHAGGDLHAMGAGLPDHVAAELRRPVDVLGVRGSGATTSRISLMRRIRADPSYLAGKKLVVWCFAARDFTEADAWRPVPLTR